MASAVEVSQQTTMKVSCCGQLEKENWAKVYQYK